MKPRKIKAVITLEVTLTGCTVAQLKQAFKDWDEGMIRVDQVVGAAKVQPVPKDA